MNILYINLNIKIFYHNIEKKQNDFYNKYIYFLNNIIYKLVLKK